MPKQKIHLALFDIKPKSKTAVVSVEKIINLRKERSYPIATNVSYGGNRISAVDQLVNQAQVASHKEIITHEIESALNEENLISDVIGQPGEIEAEQEIEKVKLYQDMPELQEFWSTPATLASKEVQDVDKWLGDLKKRRITRKPRLSRKWPWGVLMGLVLVVGISAVAFASSDFIANREEQVIINGNKAVANLEGAKSSLKELDFVGAAKYFSLAHDNFQEASGTLKNMGASIISIFGNIPGLGKVKSAQNLVSAGEYISKAGESLSKAFADFYNTNIFESLRPYDSKNGGQSLVAPIDNFIEVLTLSLKDVQKAENLLMSVDSSTIPADKLEMFSSFKNQIPLFKSSISQAIDYANLLTNFLGKNSTKTYMVILQNNSERRPTGGFPGTYAIVTFDRGVLTKMFVDDI